MSAQDEIAVGSAQDPPAEPDVRAAEVPPTSAATIETVDLYGDPSFDYQSEPEPIAPNDPDYLIRANRHMRALARLDEREQQVSRLFRAEIDRLEERMGQQLAIIDRQQTWHRRQLVNLHEAILRDNPRQKTIVLPSGELRATVPAKPKISVTEPDEFVAWAERNGRSDLLNVTTRPAKDELARAIDIAPDVPVTEPGVSVPAHDAHGERVPGVVFYLPDKRFQVVPQEQRGVVGEF